MDITSISTSQLPASGPGERSVVAAVAAQPGTSVVAPAEPRALIQQPSSVQPGAAQLSEAMEKINQSFKSRAQGVEFTQDGDRTVVKVVDQQTREVIRQMPTEEMLEISKAIDQGIETLRVSQRA